MTDTAPESITTEKEQPEAAVERTVAFFADRRASPMLLSETVAQVISSLRISRGLIDLSSIPGLSIAKAFVSAGIPYESLEFGQERIYETVSTERDPLQNPVIADDAEGYRALAAGEVTVTIADLGSIDANIAIVPAVVGPNERVIDLSPQTITGVVMEQASASGRDLLLIDAPERGLSVESGGNYVRTVIHIKDSNGAD